MSYHQPRPAKRSGESCLSVGESKPCRLHTAVAEFGHGSARISSACSLFNGLARYACIILARANVWESLFLRGPMFGNLYSCAGQCLGIFRNVAEVPPLTFRRSRLCSSYGWFIPISRPFAQKFICSNSGAVVGTGL